MKTEVNIKVKTAIEIDGKLIKTTEQVIPVSVDVVLEGEDIIIDPPNPTDPPVDDILDLDVLLSKSGVVKLDYPKSTWLKVKSKGLQRPIAQGIKANGIYLQFEDWDTAPEQLIDCYTGDFFFDGITFVCPPNRPIKTAFPSKAIFGWKSGNVLSGKFAQINAPEVTDKELVTYGLTRFAYSSTSQQNIYLIAKNVSHNGGVWTEAKNNTGNLKLMLENVKLYNPITYDTAGKDTAPSSMKYYPTNIKVRVSISNDGVAKIISDNTFDQILTHWGYWENNVASILHLNRFVYPIKKELLVDNKTLKLDSLHPLDVINGKGTILTKQINVKVPEGFDYTYDSSTANQPTETKRPVGEFDAYIVYKGTALFSFPVDKDTKFGDDYWESGGLIISSGYGWSWYNKDTEGFIKDFNGTGYFRNSVDSGRPTDRLTLINANFEKNAPPASGTETSMPKEVQDYLDYIENL